ncbi:DUF6179 domain-containing protein [Eubacterium sp. 1001713B170207_170306_E7]|uniref:DUF6179 domain-containing protein n=1 Tax=Eubacterium sp. 1001713B170207_170306_E7 TaxID=2787097 RepID=UPI00189A83F0|nr:DUF6179 domain-containing protein [Eubacterium sp. 1001713B170207_170306_E7]
MKQMEPVSTLKIKNLDPAEYTKTLLYEGVRIGMINKNNLETFQKHLSALLTRQISQYTQGGSSVKTEIAGVLTDGIFYCIDTILSQYETPEEALEKLQSSTLPSLFTEGLTQIKQEINQSKLLYNRLRGNRLKVDVYAYNTTIDDIPLFFRDYNPEFKATETPGMLEYLPCYYRKNLSGIHYMKEIIHNLYLENHFCNQFDQDEIMTLLNQFAANVGYPSRDLTENIFGLVLSNAIARKLIGNDSDSIILTEPEALSLAEQFEGQPRKKCKEAVSQAISAIIVEKGLRWPSLKTYLGKCQDKTVAGLYRSVKQETIRSFLAVR